MSYGICHETYLFYFICNPRYSRTTRRLESTPWGGVLRAVAIGYRIYFVWELGSTGQFQLSCLHHSRGSHQRKGTDREVMNKNSLNEISETSLHIVPREKPPAKIDLISPSNCLSGVTLAVLGQTEEWWQLSGAFPAREVNWCLNKTVNTTGDYIDDGKLGFSSAVCYSNGTRIRYSIIHHLHPTIIIHVNNNLVHNFPFYTVNLILKVNPMWIK